ncbi:MAG: oligosaccharide flippase family protein [Candidatus Zhuqueibacterota bacterium]
MGIVKIFSVSLIAEGLVILTGFVNSIIITRNLDLPGRGKYALTMNIITMLSLIFGDGIYRANTYLLSVDRKKLSVLFSNSIVAITAVGALLLVGVLLLTEGLIQTLVPGMNFSLLLVAISSVIPYLFIRSYSGLFLGLQHYYTYNFFVVAPLVLYCFFNVGLYFWADFTPMMVMQNYLISLTVIFIYSTIKMLRVGTLQLRPDWTVGKETLAIGFRSGASSIPLYLLFRVDVFLINYFLGIDQAGIYSVAVILSELLQKFANTSGTVIFPKISGKEKSKKSRSLSIRVVLFVLSVGLVFGLFLWFMGEKIIVFLYKDKYLAAADVLYWLLPGTIVMAAGKIFLFSLWGKGFPRVTVIVPVIAFILNTILNLSLIPKYGMIGSAVSTSISYIFFGVSLALYFFIAERFEMSGQIEDVQAAEA